MTITHISLFHKCIQGGHAWFCSIDLDAPVPKHSQPYPIDHLKAKNWLNILLKGRKRSNSAVDDKHQSTLKRKYSFDDSTTDKENRNFTTCLRYSGMIFLEYLDENELVVVEQPWLGIVNSLPDALERQRYGS